MTPALQALLGRGRKNKLRNPMALNQSSFIPQFWSTNSITGVTMSGQATGVQDGLTYIDMQFTGTNSGAHDAPEVVFETTTQIRAADGEVWSSSVSALLVSGSLPASSTGVSPRVVAMNSAGGVIFAAPSLAGMTAQISATLQRFASTQTLSGTITYVQSRFAIDWPAGAAATFVIRLAAPQLERGPAATPFSV